MNEESTDQLQLARRWVAEMGDPIHETPDISDAGGAHLPSFGLTHGPARLAIVSLRGSLLVTALAQFPPELRRTLNSLPANLQLRMMEAVKVSFMDVPRAAWSIYPTNSTRLGEVERIQLSEILRVSEDDALSFNRLADAIQELTTLYVRSQQVIATFLTSGMVADSGRPADSPGYG